jgi:hypothetical protein
MTSHGGYTNDGSIVRCLEEKLYFKDISKQTAGDFTAAIAAIKEHLEKTRHCSNVSVEPTSRPVLAFTEFEMALLDKEVRRRTANWISQESAKAGAVEEMQARGLGKVRH